MKEFLLVLLGVALFAGCAFGFYMAWALSWGFSRPPKPPSKDDLDPTSHN